MNASIAVLEGDGIGPEIVGEALKVLDAVAQRFGHRFDIRRTPFGAGAWFSHGAAFPAESKAVCDGADAILGIEASTDDGRVANPTRCL